MDFLKVKFIYILLLSIVPNVISETQLITYDNVNEKIIKSESKKVFNNFYLLNETIPNGPITLNRNEDDGTKRNLYSVVRLENNDFYYNNKKFNELEETTSVKAKYFCEMANNIPPEGQKGIDISCPKYYTIKIDDVFYGRYSNDTKRCNMRNGKILPEERLKVNNQCGYKPFKELRELCEGRVYCTIIPSNYFYMDYCPYINKYLHVKYHCKKDPELKKERIAIVMFSNKIKPNTVDENSVSEFYQYSRIHGYDFQLNEYNYNPGRSIFYSKTHTVMEKVIEGLKEKKYDWIFWADCDTTIANPNIKLEAFLPSDTMNKVHFIGTDDFNGLQAGVFFVRVHPWSLNMLMRALSYSYFNPRKKLVFHDQSAINNVLTESKESEHYIIVPQNWFDSYLNTIEKGDFILHLTGKKTPKNENARNFRNLVKNDNEWYSKTNKEMREEVLKYYNLPKKEQHSIQPQ